MWIILLGFIAFFLLSGLTYIVVTLLVIPGLADERLGRLEDLPEDAGIWKEDLDSHDAHDAMKQGLRRETRYWIDQDVIGRERIVHQVRYVSKDGVVVRTGPETRIRRKRCRA